MLLAAQPDCGGAWTDYYDALLLSNTGVGGSTRLIRSRLDALSAAAHEVARHCWRLLSSLGLSVRDTAIERAMYDPSTLGA